MKSISVVVPFYNTGHLIEQCIQSLLNQEYPQNSYEIIFIDNNSRDSSADIIRRYPRIKLISEPKRGSYAARNRGIEAASGEIIAFTDSDCEVSADWLKEIEQAMSDPAAGIVIGNNQFAKDTFLLSMLEDYENEKNNYVFTSGVKEIYYGYTRNMAVRKRLFDEMGLFLEKARGSDVIFIHNCIDRYSIDVVRSCPGIRIRHLEIDSPEKYFRKMFVYGRSSSNYRRIVTARPLSNRERFQIFRRALRRRRYSPFKTISFLFLLLTAYSYWVLGFVSNAISLRKKAR
jgi:glycosyltransferase involved in cell wall biosynthesis